MAFQSKDIGVLGRQLKVQELAIPFAITAHATAASKVVVSDEPAIMFLNVEGITGISTATGALASGESAPSLATATDSTGVINLLVKVGEPMAKVVSAVVFSRAVAAGLSKPCNILAFATGTNAAQSIYLNCTTGVNLSTTSLDGVLIVKYIVDESA
jgi:hypothetical protein